MVRPRFLPRTVVAGALAFALGGFAGGGSVCGAAEAFEIDDVTVIDVESGKLRSHRTVVIEGRWIVGIHGPEMLGARRMLPKRRLSGRGAYLIPGLWDMHAHVCNDSITGLTSAALLLAHGVTGVRDMAGPLDSVLAFREAAKTGRRASPRAIVAGPLVDGVPPATEGDIAVRTPAEARAAVDSLWRAKVDFIKAYEMLTPGAFRALVDQASLRGLPVAGHLPLAVDAFEASSAGMRSFEHLRNLELACSVHADSLLGARTAWLDSSAAEPGRSLRGRILNTQRPIALDTEDPIRRNALLATLKRNGTWQVPTLFLDEAPLVLSDSAALARVRKAADPCVSREMTDWWDETARGWLASPPDARERARRVARWQREFVRSLRDAGVGILAGSDMPNLLTAPGASLHEELRALRDAGLTNLEALRAATIEPARFLGKAEFHGTVEAWKVADLVLLDANPLEDITHTTRIRAVVADGRLYEREDLDRLLEGARRIARGQAARVE